MTPDEVIALLKQTSARLEREKQRWFRKRTSMSANDNEKFRAIAALSDELVALHLAIVLLRKESQ